MNNTCEYCIHNKGIRLKCKGVWLQKILYVCDKVVDLQRYHSHKVKKLSDFGLSVDCPYFERSKEYDKS